MLKGVGARRRSDDGRVSDESPDSMCIASLADPWVVETATSYSYESEGVE